MYERVAPLLMIGATERDAAKHREGLRQADALRHRYPNGHYLAYSRALTLLFDTGGWTLEDSLWHGNVVHGRV